MVIVLLIILGLCFGSFVNAFVWRMRAKDVLVYKGDLETEANGMATKAEKATKTDKLSALSAAELSITKGRSMCVHCHHELAPKDLIPVVSYLTLGGKCRYCRQPIQDTPLSELMTPLLFVVSYLTWPQPLHGAHVFTFCLWLVFLVGFVALAIYDIRWFELPHKIVLPLIGLAAVQTFAVAFGFDGGWHSLARAGAGALLGGGIFLVLYIVSPKQKLEDGTSISAWIGGGDITLGTLIGLLVGGPGGALLLIFMASLVGTLVALPLLVAGKANRRTHLPFGPYLLLAGIIVQLWGTGLISWYTSLFLGT